MLQLRRAHRGVLGQPLELLEGQPVHPREVEEALQGLEICALRGGYRVVVLRQPQLRGVPVGRRVFRRLVPQTWGKVGRIFS